MIIDALRYTLQNPDGVFWKDTDYHKQKKIEFKNPVFKLNKAKHRNTICKKMRK
ncbi:hypothetical protein QM953_09995 [Streptococcus cristatus]|jgi:hypothetical protein|uniref:hypothetical protein n=1 Tax=Streptococcus TaxID=1301 RepID=UPI003081A97E|nr:hypothetical protein LPZ00_000496 [Streptococcus anginosus]